MGPVAVWFSTGPSLLPAMSFHEAPHVGFLCINLVGCRLCMTTCVCSGCRLNSCNCGCSQRMHWADQKLNLPWPQVSFVSLIGFFVRCHPVASGAAAFSWIMQLHFHRLVLRQHCWILFLFVVCECRNFTLNVSWCVFVEGCVFFQCFWQLLFLCEFGSFGLFELGGGFSCFWPEVSCRAFSDLHLGHFSASVWVIFLCHSSSTS